MIVLADGDPNQALHCGFAHLVGDRMAAVTCQTIDTGADQEMRVMRLWFAEELVNVVLPIANVNLPLRLAQRFTARLGLPEAESAVVPILVGTAEDALALSAALEARGFLVVAIRPPTVPAGTARLRVAFSAAHGEAEVDALAEAIAALR